MSTIDSTGTINLNLGTFNTKKVIKVFLFNLLVKDWL